MLCPKLSEVVALPPLPILASWLCHGGLEVEFEFEGLYQDWLALLEVLMVYYGG